MAAGLGRLLRGLTTKGRTLRLYVKVLPARLRKDYGHRGPYTPDQIESTIRRHSVGHGRYVPYAIALFADGGALPPVWNGTRLQDLRTEVSGAWFGGEPFSYHDLMSYCSPGADLDGCPADGAYGHDGGSHT